MDYLLTVLKEIFIFYNEVAIYLIFGFFIAAILHVIFPDSLVKKHLGKDSIGSVFKSSIFGIPIPLCSCGVVPVATSIKNSGASKGATISFLISTPQVGADSFMITYSLLGWFFGVFRIIASFFTAITAGIFVNILAKNSDGALLPMAGNGNGENIKDRIRSIFSYIEYTLLGSIADSLLIGMIIAGLISALVPNDFFGMYLSSNLMSMIIMLVVGIPMYICASASTPIAASLIMKGMSPGAALVFLLAGPATNAMSIGAILKVVGKRATVIYLSVIAAGSIMMGYILNIITNYFGISNVIMFHNHELLPAWLKTAGAVLLGIMLLIYYLKIKIIPKIFSDANNETVAAQGKITLNVSGMTCMHCAGSVTKAVESVESTGDVLVNLSKGNVSFKLENANDLESVKRAVTSAGFTVGELS